MTLEFFGSDKGNKDGFNMYCKICQKKNNDEYYAKTGDIQRERANKRLEDEEVRKKNQRYFKFWYIRNAEKDRADTNRYRAENPNYSKEYNHKYLSTEHGKAVSRKHSRFKGKHRLHKITSKQWDLCKAFFNYSCCYCGLPIEQHLHTYRGIIKVHDLQKDHAIDEGSNTLRNCLPACKSCNSKKHTSSINNWYNPNNLIYTKERYLLIYQWLRYGCKEVLRITYKPKKVKK